MVGIQNKSTLNEQFPSRLAPKNKANNKTTMIQNTGERRLCVSPPATAPNPVVFVVLKSRNITHIPGPNKARNNAANMLRMIFK